MNNQELSPLGKAIVLSAMIGFVALCVFALYNTVMAFSESPPVKGAIRMSPDAGGLPIYHIWYDKTAGCAQLPSLDYYKIEWYVVPDVISFPTDIGEKVALWERLSDGYVRITIADAYVGNEMVVRHEMLHDLLARNSRDPVTGHPALYFEDRCQLTWRTWQGAK